jgi:hypothetical protein
MDSAERSLHNIWTLKLFPTSASHAFEIISMSHIGDKLKGAQV